ncbi:hypothetical protein N9L06_03040 [Mariniblastus sp.]|nr:hypothetical protein [Mariniblastus sp.]
MSDSQSNRWKHLLVIGLLLIGGLLVYNSVDFGEPDDPSTSEQRTADGRKKKKKPLPDFLTKSPVLLPGIFEKRVDAFGEKPDGENENELDFADRLISDPGNSALRLNRTKAGHWYTAQYPVLSNRQNIDGELSTQTVLPTSQPVPVPHTRYWPVHKRPVSLAKKEWKNLETSVYVPVRTDVRNNVSSVLVSFSLDQQSASLIQASVVQPISAMKSFQHHFVVLTDRPDDWSFMKLTDSFQLSGKLSSGDLKPPIYFLVPSIPGSPVPLSRNPLQWTTVAYVLWDDLPANALDPDQQSAMIDWLHHGGQLIISGPDCLDRLRNSFLADYLPASFDGSINLTADEVKTLNEHWSVSTDSAETRELTLSPTRPIPGVRFEPHPDSNFVDRTGEIAIERQIGRGRIVVTAFSLMDRRVRKWLSFQSFLNGALLRKPAREFKRNANTLETNFSYSDNSTTIYDPLMASSVRFLSRDLGTAGTESTANVTLNRTALNTGMGFNKTGMGFNSGIGSMDLYDTELSGRRDLSDTLRYGGYQDQPNAGVGGWNDFSGIANAARAALRERAGIKPPSADFVLKMLGGYLLILVPLNWLIFRSIGKVEYAWAAAPIIAIAGAIGVVKMASLDIGFVRSNTELGLLEVFADHPRAHLTQYSALYTSLTTRYEAELDNSTSQALPFAASKTSGLASPNQTPFSTVTLERSVQNRLENLQVQSNSTGLLHIETMLDLEGTFSRPNVGKLTNTSNVSMDAAGVIRRSDDGKQYSVAWIGALESGQTVDLNFKTMTGENPYQQWLVSPKLASVTRQARTIWKNNVPEDRKSINLDELLEFSEIQNNLDTFRQLATLMESSNDTSGFSLEDFRELFSSVQGKEDTEEDNFGAGDLFDTVADNLILGPGEVRLLGVTEQALSLGKLEPAATQTRRQTLVVVHLKSPKLPAARRDVNAYQDKANLSNIDLEEEAEMLEETFDERVNP